MLLDGLQGKRRAIYFVGILVAYLIVLHGFSPPRAEGFVRACVRPTVAALELGLSWMACEGLYRLGRKRKSFLATGLCAAIGLAVAAIYASQLYALHLSGNFISVLAIQNSAESRIVRNATLYGSFALAFAWWLFFLSALGWSNEVAAQGVLHGHRWSRALRVSAVAALVAAAVVLFCTQKDRGLLEARYAQSPLIAFARSYYDARPTAKRSGEEGSSTGRDWPLSMQYPLAKSNLTDAPLPFGKKGVAHPNVIVLFTEGMSARLLGCYGGSTPGLTPNIDRLARVSMRVDHYYNHTAATYRALQGQMVSGYPAAGGGDDDRMLWETDQGMAKLAAIRYRSISMILHDHGYGTYFVSPHHNSVGLNTMLRSLSFDRVFTFDDAGQFVAPANPFYAIEGALSDDDVFTTLRSLMSNGSLGASGRPFFVGLYNFGTHAFLDIMPNGEKYGDGKNASLNKVHNYDHAFGKFLDYFLASPYAHNTILILTSDHAAYPEPSFREVAGTAYKPYFVDRIPLIIYDPTHELPATFDAKGRTSIDFAPTLMQMLNISKGENSFIGTSLFGMNNQAMGFAAIGEQFYATDSNGVYTEDDVPAQWKSRFSLRRDEVQTYYELEKENRLYLPDAGEGRSASVEAGP